MKISGQAFRFAGRAMHADSDRTASRHQITPTVKKSHAPDPSAGKQYRRHQQVFAQRKHWNLKG